MAAYELRRLEISCQINLNQTLGIHNNNLECMREERGVYRVLVGKPEGKRLLGRPRRKWEDNIRIDLQEEGCGGMDWIGLP
jgi:hypothetical protein